MKVVDYKEYSSNKQAFLERHNYEYRIETSSMNEYGVYHKEYICDDGAIFYEVMGPVYEKVTTEVHKVTITVDVKLFRTEYYSSDDAESKYYYERF